MLSALTVTLSLLVQGQSTPPPITTVGPPTVVTESDVKENQPPRGAREDQALWRAAHAQYGESQVEVERTRGMIIDLRTGGYRERLAAAGKAAGAEAAKDADALWTKLAGAADEAYQVSSKPPFNLRTGCRYDLLRFEQAMGAKPRDAAAAELPVVRSKLQLCQRRLDAFVKPLVKANGRLAAALEETKGFLAAHPEASATPLEPAAAPARPATGG